MKRAIIAFVVLMTSLSATSAFAGGYGSSRMGIMAGITSSTANLRAFDSKNVSMYHVGLTGELPLGLGFSIQPSLLYQVKGVSLDQMSESLPLSPGAPGSNPLFSVTDGLSGLSEKFDASVGYVEIPLQIQWGPDLLLFRPYVLAEPFVGYRINYKTDAPISQTDFGDALKKVEYGLGVGAGIDVWKLQLSAKWFWNFGGLYNSNTAATLDTIKSMDNFHGVVVSLSLFL